MGHRELRGNAVRRHAARLAFLVEPEALKRERQQFLRDGLRVETIGFILVVLGFGALQIILDRNERDDGFSSNFVSTMGLPTAPTRPRSSIMRVWRSILRHTTVMRGPCPLHRSTGWCRHRQRS